MSDYSDYEASIAALPGCYAEPMELVATQSLWPRIYLVLRAF